MFKVTFENSACVLDSRTVDDAGEVLEAIQKMLGKMDTFYSGDKILITDLDEDI